MTTLNHDVDPDRRADMLPAPIVIGRKVWLGAAVTVVPGVTIGDGAGRSSDAVVAEAVAIAVEAQAEAATGAVLETAASVAVAAETAASAAVKARRARAFRRC